MHDEKPIIGPRKSYSKMKLDTSWKIKNPGGIVLFLIFSAAAIIRLVGIRFCLPLKYCHIDESIVVFYSFRVLTGVFDLYPFYLYPAFYFYILAFFFFIYFLLLKSFGIVSDLNSFSSLYLGETHRFILVGRLVSSVFNLASGFIFWKILGEVFEDRKSYLRYILLVIYFLLPRTLVSSHYSTVDNGANFFWLLSLYCLLRFSKRGDLRSLLFLGIATGFSAGIKYYGIIALLPAFVILIKKKEYSMLLLLGGVSFLCFFAVSPFSVLRIKNTIDLGLKNQMGAIVVPGLEFAKYSLADSGYVSHIKRAFSDLGPVILISSLAGIIILYGRKRNLFLPLTLFFLSYYILTGTWQIFFTRYSIPFYPLLIIFFGVFLEAVSEKYPVKKWLAGLLVIFALVPVLYTDFRVLRIFTSQDTREQARDWCIKNLPAGSRIYRTQFGPEFDKASGFPVYVDWVMEKFQACPEEFIKRFDYFIIAVPLQENIKKYFDRLQPAAQFKGDGFLEFHNPEIRIYRRASAAY